MDCCPKCGCTWLWPINLGDCGLYECFWCGLIIDIGTHDYRSEIDDAIADLAQPWLFEEE